QLPRQDETTPKKKAPSWWPSVECNGARTTRKARRDARQGHSDNQISGVLIRTRACAKFLHHDQTLQIDRHMRRGSNSSWLDAKSSARIIARSRCLSHMMKRALSSK
ncbi:unnamed protein product, partial [Ectocarpus fasciculatus]